MKKEISEIVLATHNPKKAIELRAVLGDSPIKIITLDDLEIFEELPETHESMEENAIEKAMYVYEKTGKCVLADDSGLEVDFLGGSPGVFSARYAGPHNDAEANIQKLLSELVGVNERDACFKTVLAFVCDGESQLFIGEISGEILREKRGQNGFGYDPIFLPKGMNRAFAEMNADEKNRISHRSVAMRKFLNYILNTK